MTNPLLAGLPPTHPGEILADILESVKEGKAEVARLLGTSRQSLYDIVKGEQSITAAMALKLGKLFGNSPEFWLNLQNAYDLRAAEAELGDQLKAIPTLQAA